MASVSNKQFNKVNGVENFRNILFLSGIPETASKHIKGARREPASLPRAVGDTLIPFIVALIQYYNSLMNFSSCDDS